jgi:deoxyribodipyrimidine photo-lyase
MVDFPTEKSPFYYTKFKNKVIAQPFSPSPVEKPEKIPSLPNLSFENEETFFDPGQWEQMVGQYPFHGGESSGLKAFHKYLDQKGPFFYNQTRDYLNWENAGSGLAPWLANGTLSPRLLYDKLSRLNDEHPQHAENLQPFLEQLIWRDYFRYLFLRYGIKLFTVQGLRKTQPDMYNDHQAFQLWLEGKTGEPIIDALMRQLKNTGFISNRGRMLVAFYLAKEMKVNWQWGAAWFESMLVDYDVCSNYGNWGYQSGRGTDSRVNRRFNLKKQTEKFDPEGRLRERWLKAF